MTAGALAHADNRRASSFSQLLAETKARLGREALHVIATRHITAAGEKFLDEYLLECIRLDIDPLSGMIVGDVRNTKEEIRENGQTREVWVMKMTKIITLEAALFMVDRTGQYGGLIPLSVQWDERNPNNPFPVSATAGVIRKGFSQPVYATRYFREFAQKKRSGDLTKQWQEKPVAMLEKCSIKAALDRAFPAALNNLYLAEEAALLHEEPINVTPPALQQPPQTPQERQTQQLDEMRQRDREREPITVTSHTPDDQPAAGGETSQNLPKDDPQPQKATHTIGAGAMIVHRGEAHEQAVRRRVREIYQVNGLDPHAKQDDQLHIALLQHVRTVVCPTRNPIRWGDFSTEDLDKYLAGKERFDAAKLQQPSAKAQPAQTKKGGPSIVQMNVLKSLLQDQTVSGEEVGKAVYDVTLEKRGASSAIVKFEDCTNEEATIVLQRLRQNA